MMFEGPYCSKISKSQKNASVVYEEPEPLTISMTIPTIPMLTTSEAPTTLSTDLKQSALMCSKLIPNPCQNGGTCVFSNHTRSFSCSCPPTYTDPLCGTRVPFCENDPCKNGGTCHQNPGEFEGNCTCLPNYGGPTCEIVLTCYPNPCKKNASSNDFFLY